MDEAFNGDGAKKYGGRWHSVGLPCVYLASSESLAVLEVVVHLNTSNVTPAYTLFSLDINENDILQLPNEYLPSDWQDYPAPASTSKIGDQWLSSLTSSILSVPSTVIPRERNFLLNVTHPDSHIIIKSVVELPFF